MDVSNPLGGEGLSRTCRAQSDSLRAIANHDYSARVNMMGAERKGQVKMMRRVAPLVAVVMLSVACTAEPTVDTDPRRAGSSTAEPSATPSDIAPANAKVFQHASHLLGRAGVTSLCDADDGDRQMPNASLTGLWQGSPAIIYVAPASVDRSILRVVSTSVIAGTEVSTVAPEDSALRPATFRFGSHIWQVTVTGPNRIRSDVPKTRSLIRALLDSD